MKRTKAMALLLSVLLVLTACVPLPEDVASAFGAASESSIESSAIESSVIESSVVESGVIEGGDEALLLTPQEALAIAFGTAGVDRAKAEVDWCERKGEIYLIRLHLQQTEGDITQKISWSFEIHAMSGEVITSGKDVSTVSLPAHAEVAAMERTLTALYHVYQETGEAYPAGGEVSAAYAAAYLRALTAAFDADKAAAVSGLPGDALYVAWEGPALEKALVRAFGSLFEVEQLQQTEFLVQQGTHWYVRCDGPESCCEVRFDGDRRSPIDPAANNTFTYTCLPPMSEGEAATGAVSTGTIRVYIVLDEESGLLHVASMGVEAAAE